MKYVVLASFLVSSCVSAKEVPLQDCVSVLQNFAPDNCVSPPGGGVFCQNAKGGYILVSRHSKELKPQIAARFDQKGPEVTCSVEGAQYEATFWQDKQSLTENRPHLEHKTL